MNKFAARSTAIEIMDDLNCSGEVVNQTLRELEFINRTLGGNAITLNGVRALLKNSSRPVSILDLGCGGGDMLLLLQRKLGRQFPAMMLTGIDANPNIIHYAQQHCQSSHDITFKAINIFSDEFSALSCDIATATLFLHHFTHEQLVTFLRQLVKQCKVGIVINDLHRHPLAYYSIAWLTRLFSKSAMVKFDAPLSVLRGFSREEWKTILAEAGITRYTLRWKWAFRWEVIIYSK